MFWRNQPVLVDGILDLASYMADMAHPSFVLQGQVTPTNSDSIAIATSAEETATRGGGGS